MDHFSPSQLDMLLNRCGRQWYYRYAEGLIIPPGVTALVGTGAHAGIEHNLLHKIDTGEMAPMDEVMDATRDALNKSWERGVRLLPEEQEQGETSIKGISVDKAIRAARLHRTEVAPVLNPVDVERYWEIAIPGFPRTVRGRIDIQEEDAIRDTKTSGKSPAKDLAERHSQLTWYALASQVIDGVPAGKVALDYIVIGKNDTKYVPLESTRGEDDFRREIDRLEIACNLVEHEIFQPADPTSGVCSPKWCGYWNRCPHGSKQSKTISYAITGGHAAPLNEDPDEGGD